MQVAEYSQYSLAVTGDTKKFKDKLKEIGGKFNGKLSVGPGWIFPKKDLEKLKSTFGQDIKVNGEIASAPANKRKSDNNTNDAASLDTTVTKKAKASPAPFEVFDRDAERFIVTNPDPTCDILSELKLAGLDVVPVRGWAFKMEDATMVMDAIDLHKKELLSQNSTAASQSQSNQSQSSNASQPQPELKQNI